MGTGHAGDQLDGPGVAIAAVPTHHQGASLDPWQHPQDGFDEAFQVSGLFKLLAAFAQSGGARFLVLESLCQGNPLNCGLSTGGNVGHRGPKARLNLGPEPKEWHIFSSWGLGPLTCP